MVNGFPRDHPAAPFDACPKAHPLATGYLLPGTPPTVASLRPSQSAHHPSAIWEQHQRSSGPVPAERPGPCPHARQGGEASTDTILFADRSKLPGYTQHR